MLAVAGIAAITKSVTNSAGATVSTTVGTFPKVLVANVAGLQVNAPVTFNYPLDNEPNLLVKVGQKAVGGVGPDGDIVAFSNICQHLGCIYGFQAPGTSPPCAASFVAKGPMGYCCCHGSQYDFLNGAAVIGGPAPRPVPSVVLEVDPTGNIYATGMNPPAIFGHNTGSEDTTNDLQGGNLVGGSQ
ncbi:MAG TPA: Rieske 2Fe-2S domain-containing protein [Nitrososphaerales archaeon]|nr:Rieske 2Fe-2S domain-containing protein [Nitrososphaerales archaeon]